MLEFWKPQTFGKNRMFFVLEILLYFYRNIAFSLGYFVSDAPSNRLVLKLPVFFSDSSTRAMPIRRNACNRFAVGKFVKARKSLQEELAKEKASLSTEVNTLQ